jgi:hypothetical protein
MENLNDSVILSVTKWFQSHKQGLQPDRISTIRVNDGSYRSEQLSGIE